MNIKKVPISQVDVWEKNPRNIKTKDMERLKRQIQELSEFVPDGKTKRQIDNHDTETLVLYKPLVAYPENGKYKVLGGNMRLIAMREMGIKEVDLSIVYPKTEADKIKIALSDNDRAGEYEEQQLAELVYPYIEEINLEDFKVDLGYSVSIKNVLEEFGPDFIPKEKEVDENIETKKECPKCGYKW